MIRKLLCISTVWPQANATAAGVRLLELLKIIKEFGYEIHMAATSTEELLRKPLEDIGITTHFISLNNHSFNSFISNLSPEIVLFDRFVSEEQFGWRVAEYAPQAIRILDTEDLHSLRYTRALCLKTQKDFSIDLWKSQEITKRELASIFRSDLSLVVSSVEYDLLIQHFSVSKQILHLLPISFSKSKGSTPSEALNYEKRTDYVFIGNGIHKPNIDAVLWLYNDIWPEILKLHKTATLNVYGAYLPEQITQLDQSKKGFNVKGRVEDVLGVMHKARVNFAPLRYGAGIKGKILDGFRAGLPNISTAIGAEGMIYENNWPGIICDSPQQFAAAAVALYHNKVLWETKSALSKTYIARYFTSSKYSTELKIILEAIENNLSAHRNINFFGTILSHQSFQASKYLSLWISEKNKNS